MISVHHWIVIFTEPWVFFVRALSFVLDLYIVSCKLIFKLLFLVPAGYKNILSFHDYCNGSLLCTVRLRFSISHKKRAHLTIREQVSGCAFLIPHSLCVLHQYDDVFVFRFCDFGFMPSRTLNGVSEFGSFSFVICWQFFFGLLLCVSRFGG